MGTSTGQLNMAGPNSSGTVFKITPSGTLTTLYRFVCSQSGCPDGVDPTAGLVQAANGDLYGTTQGSYPNCPEGAQPFAGLRQAADLESGFAFAGPEREISRLRGAAEL